MSEIPNPFQTLVSGRLATYFEEAFLEYGKGRIRGAYDYFLLALNSTLFELKPKGKRLFERLDALAADGKLGADVVESARSCDFLVKHDRGITDMDVTYMSVDDVQDFVRFLERFYRSLNANGVALANNPGGH